MTKDAATLAAQNTANEYGKPILLFNDAISQSEFEDGPWGYCPPGGADLLAKWRDVKQDNLIYPNEKRRFIKSGLTPEAFVISTKMLLQVADNRRDGRAERREDVLDGLESVGNQP